MAFFGFLAMLNFSPDSGLGKTLGAPKDDRQNQLLSLRVQKLKEQKQVAVQMNEILDKLHEESKKTRRNLVNAIAVSKRPGYFHYHETDPEVKQYESNKVLSNFARTVQKLNNEIEQIDTEIEQSKIARDTRISEVPISSLGQWFDTYGKPKEALQEDLLTTFQSSSKVYGGTKHHCAFKSQASTMIKGKITR